MLIKTSILQRSAALGLWNGRPAVLRGWARLLYGPVPAWTNRSVVDDPRQPYFWVVHHSETSTCVAPSSPPAAPGILRKPVGEIIARRFQAELWTHEWRRLSFKGNASTSICRPASALPLALRATSARYLFLACAGMTFYKGHKRTDANKATVLGQGCGRVQNDDLDLQ